MRQPQLCQGGKASGLCDVSVQAAGRARQPVGCAVSPAASDLCSLAPGIQLRERRECTGRGSSLPAPRLGLRWGCAPAWMRGDYTTGISARRCRFPNGLSRSQRDGSTDPGAACAAGGPGEAFLARQPRRCSSAPPRVPLGCDQAAEATVSRSCWQPGLFG